MDTSVPNVYTGILICLNPKWLNVPKMASSKWKFPKQELVMLDKKILDEHIQSIFRREARRKNFVWLSTFVREGMRNYGYKYWDEVAAPLVQKYKEEWIKNAPKRALERRKAELDKLQQEDPSTSQVRVNIKLLNDELTLMVDRINDEIEKFYSRDTILLKKLRELFDTVEAMYTIVKLILEAKRTSLHHNPSDDQMLVLLASDYNESTKTLAEIQDSIFHEDKGVIGDNERGKDLYNLALMYRNRLRLFKAKTDFIIADVLKDTDNEDESKD